MGVAALNLPGHVPLDTISALWEGRHHLRMTWGPRMYSALLGLFDAIVPGFGLFTASSMLLLFIAWFGLSKISPRVGWAAPVLLGFWLLTPDVLIFQGIVWRDILFANFTVAGFVALAAAAAVWARPPRRYSLLALAALSLALAALVRQNGGVVIAAAAAALAWMGRRDGLSRALAWGVGGFVATFALALALAVINPVREPPGGRSHSIGPRLLAQYDIVAAVADNPQRPMPPMAAARPDLLAIIRREAPRIYTPQRIDTIDRDLPLQHALWRFPAAVIQAQWRALLAEDPLGYARRRLEIFRWVFLTPTLEACVPLHVGVQGLPQIEQQLGVRRGDWLQDDWLRSYARRWYATPAYSHLTYAVLALALSIFLLVRRRAADVPIAALLIGVLGFTATFLVVSIACDYRYLYALDLAAITGTLYLAMDPSIRRANPGESALRP